MLPIRIAILVLFCASWPRLAIAQEPLLPSFNVRGYCIAMEVGSSGSYDTQRCLQDETRSAEAVKANWERVPVEPRVTCARIARDAGQSFFVLEACLRSISGNAWIEVPASKSLAERSQLISRGFRR
jgi:hypothetical protein